MHINVRNAQAESIGFSEAYKIAGEWPALESVKLTDTIEGSLSVARLEQGLLVTGQARTSVELTCDRCLCTFSRPVTVKFRQVFTDDPGYDEMPIIDHEIDIAPLIEQEIILALPIKILDSPDCPGIADAPSENTANDQAGRIRDRARITKGNKRGRS